MRRSFALCIFETFKQFQIVQSRIRSTLQEIVSNDDLQPPESVAKVTTTTSPSTPLREVVRNDAYAHSPTPKIQQLTTSTARAQPPNHTATRFEEALKRNGLSDLATELDILGQRLARVATYNAKTYHKLYAMYLS